LNQTSVNVGFIFVFIKILIRVSMFKFFISISLFLLTAVTGVSGMPSNSKFGVNTKWIFQQSVDTTQPVSTADKKVVTSIGDNGLEISPYSSFNSGVLIQPINRVSNQGLSTAFYLKDTASWSFYTASKEQLKINGNGDVSVRSKLLINNALSDGTSSLRVNGTGRFDSSLYIQAASDTGSFINFSRNVKYVTEADDGISAYTTTPVAWAMGNNIPVFRIRHPYNVTVNPYLNSGISRDFMILPYQYGTAIEYNGVVECWVGEWSIHKGLYYYDVENKGDGWGAVLWVGDDEDRGGIRATARNNTLIGGNVAYGELSVEKFGLGDVSNGDFRLRLPSVENQFQFVYGGRGSTNIVAKLNNTGIIIPKVSSVSSVAAPEKAQVAFDSTDNHFKGFDGTKWVILSGSNLITGTFITSSNGANYTYSIPHGLGAKPSYFNVIATSATAANFNYVSADAVNIYVNYYLPPSAGTNNISWNWQVKE
jgi:hypothetical protein